MKDQANDKRSLIIVGALVLTAAFLFAFGWLLSRTVTCPEGWWLWHRLDCLEPNALGDTFAGAFAPVAFVWLVAAVLLQRNELAAQRQELRETREVSVQQVAEARKNVELISEQTAMLKSDRERIQQREADEDIDEMVSILVDELRRNANLTYINEGIPVENEHGNTPADARIIVVEDGNDYSELEKYVDGFRSLLTQAAILKSEGVTFHHSGTYSYSGALRIIQQINELLEKASPPKKALLSAKGFDGLSRFVPGLISVIEEHGQKEDDIPF